MYSSKINNNDITIQKNTLSINDTLEENNNSSFSFLNSNYISMPIHCPVEIKENENDLFKGYTANIGQTLSVGGKLISSVDCIGQDYLLNKRLISKAFVGEPVEEIVRYIVRNVLQNEGVVEGIIDAPAIVDKIAFDSITCSEALDQLLMFGDYIWNIDNNKKINFHSMKQSRCKYDLDFTKQDCIAVNGEYTIEQDANDYRNTVLLKGLKGLSPRTEILKCDGNATSWNTKMNISSITELYVDRNDSRGWVAVSFSINESDNATTDFVYSIGSNQLTQVLHQEDEDDEGNNPNVLSSDSKIKILYNGEYDLVLKYSSQADIEIKKQIDKTSGIHEVVEEVNIKGLGQGLQYIRNNIQQNNKSGYRISFRTDKRDIHTLEYIKVTIPQLKIKEDFLITSINMIEDNEIFYEVSIVSGSLKDSYLVQLFGDREKFRTDLESSMSTETVNIPLTFEKTWTPEETPNIFNCSLFPRDDLFPSDTLYPALPETERLKFIQLYKVIGPEIYEPFLRVPVIADEVANNGDMYISTAVIDDTVEFEDMCVSIGWIASDGYNEPTVDDFNSGFEIVRSTVDVPFNKIKDLEFVTIFRIDNKWSEEE